MTKGTFYYYFDSKLGILEAMFDELLVQAPALLHEIVADETPAARDRLIDRSFPARLSVV